MFISSSYLGGGYLPYDPQNPEYEKNILRLAEKNPRHPEVQKYRQLIVGEQAEEIRSEMREELENDPDLTAEDIAAVEEMLKLAKEDDPDSEPEYESNDDICKAFADGKI